MVPEEIGTINKPIEGVTGARGIGGSFTCYLVFGDATGNTGASADFADLVSPTKGLTKVVNDFDVTFKVGGTVSTEPRVHFNLLKVHIDVPSHSIEDVISLETNFGVYTEDFDTADEFNIEGPWSYRIITATFLLKPASAGFFFPGHKIILDISAHLRYNMCYKCPITF